MLLQKLYNGEITVDIVNISINNSIKTYDVYISKLVPCLAKPTRQLQKIIAMFLNFISDDIYEFDCISNFSRTMIRLGVNVPVWKNIYSLVDKYNNVINTKEELYTTLHRILIANDTVAIIDEHDRSFISKILTSHKHHGYNINDQRFIKLNEKISLIEKKLLCHDDVAKNSDDAPTILLTKSELADMPADAMKKFYNSSTGNYDLTLNRLVHSICHKYISKSAVRKKIDDVLYKKYIDNIPLLVYLFVYRDIKAKFLGYDSYTSYVTQHQKDYIKNLLIETVQQLETRCKLELDIISNLKYRDEKTNCLFTWDIAYYINQWKNMYGINESEISEYFELNSTIDNIIKLLSMMFTLTFVPDTKYNKWCNDIKMYKISKNGVIVGELILDLMARDSKDIHVQTVCVNTRCCYPHELLNKSSAKDNVNIFRPANIIMSDFIIKGSGVTLLTINDLHRLFIEFGKVICYISNVSTYSIFGGMYTNIKYIDIFGKFVDLCLFEPTLLQYISCHYKTKTKLLDETVQKIHKQMKLDNGITYKYQCMYGLFDLYAHSDESFIASCKQCMKISDDGQRKKDITELMYGAYNTFYSTMFDKMIGKDEIHFHPIKWSYLFNGNENINFLKILSDIYAYDMLKQLKMSLIDVNVNNSQNNTTTTQMFNVNLLESNGKQFCVNLFNFIGKTKDSDIIDLDTFLKHIPTVETLFCGIGVNKDDSMLSLFNCCDVPKNIFDKHDSPKVTKTHNSSDLSLSDFQKEELYLSPTIKPKKTKQQNYFEEVSENDPEIRKILGEVIL